MFTADVRSHGEVGPRTFDGDQASRAAWGEEGTVPENAELSKVLLPLSLVFSTLFGRSVSAAHTDSADQLC